MAADLPTAQGTRVELDDGRSVLDATSGAGAAPFGHRHPALVDAPDADARTAGGLLLALAPEGLEHVALVASEDEALALAAELAARAGRGRLGGERDAVFMEAGVDPAALVAARGRADAAGALLVVDERLTGLGRTGTHTACDHVQLLPDVLVLGRGLGGGVEEVAAVLWTARVERSATRAHPPAASTASPAACAVAAATAGLLVAPDWRGAVARIAAELEAGLEPLAGASVLGALAVVDLDRPADPVTARRAALDQGVLLEAQDGRLRVRPPYGATSQEVARVAAGLRAATRAALR